VISKVSEGMDSKVFWTNKKKELKLLDLHLLKNQLHKLLTKFEDANIQIPAIVAAYRTSMKTRDARVLDMISSILSDGKARDCIKIVDDKKMALQIGALSNNQEDYRKLHNLRFANLTPQRAFLLKLI
jgi:hypothetical protein